MDAVQGISSVKLEEVMSEGLLQQVLSSPKFKERISKIKAAIGSSIGKVVPSLKWLLKLFKGNKNVRLTTVEKLTCSIGGEILCRIDTGATICSIDAQNIQMSEDQKKVSFTAYGRDYKDVAVVRIYKATNASGTTHRPVIQTDWEWNDKKYSGIETNVIDRKKMKFKGLIGRNLILELKLPVHVADNDDIKGEDAETVDLKPKGEAA